MPNTSSVGAESQINRLEAHSPATTLNVTGLLGVYPVERPSNLSVHLVNHNLGEFDHVLKALDLGIDGKPGYRGPSRLCSTEMQPSTAQRPVRWSIPHSRVI